MDFRSTHPNRASHHQTRQTQYPCLRGNHERIPKRSEKAIAEPLFRMATPYPDLRIGFRFRRISGGYPAAAPPQNRRPTARLPTIQPPALPPANRRPIRSTCPVTSGLLPASCSDVSRHRRDNDLSTQNGVRTSRSEPRLHSSQADLPGAEIVP